VGQAIVVRGLPIATWAGFSTLPILPGAPLFNSAVSVFETPDFHHPGTDF
jgi:hypothetical protein